MKYTLFALLLCFSFLGKSQIIGNWYFSDSTNLFEADTLIAFKTNPTPKDTVSVLKIDSNGYLQYCPKHLITPYNNAIAIYCSPITYSNCKYINYNDTLQFIFYNTYFQLTDSEIKKLSHQQLSDHYKTFGKSNIIYFKTIIDTSSKLVLVKLHVQ